MEDVLKETSQVIEVPEAIPSPVEIPEAEGGVPWCGAGIVLVVVVEGEVEVEVKVTV